VTLIARPKRKPVPLKTQLHAALYQLGLEPHEVELDHDPALGIRPVNDKGTDYDPPQHDPKCLIWRPKADHLRKTTGRKGESDLSITGNGDTSRAAKCDRIEEAHIQFRRRLLSPSEMADYRENKKSKWPKRSFPKRRKSP
jgi:hypothetical protein